MDPFESITRPQKADLLICFCDIEGFSAIARAKPDPLELFALLDGFAREMQSALAGSAGRIVKLIGDSALIVFPADAADAGMQILLELKPRLERYLAPQGTKARVLFQVHVGEVAVGPLGGDGALDVIGDSVNVAARLGRGEHRGVFVISPQAFRRLRPATRKLFHKHTPPVVYVAER
jgi:class 3 adenylate cyclase